MTLAGNAVPRAVNVRNLSGSTNVGNLQNPVDGAKTADGNSSEFSASRSILEPRFRQYVK
jgi:hypothetical protein